MVANCRAHETACRVDGVLLDLLHRRNSASDGPVRQDAWPRTEAARPTREDVRLRARLAQRFGDTAS